jgi:glutamate/tyrosine decarboxylase-like PLP-dependent enzyme
MNQLIGTLEQILDRLNNNQDSHTFELISLLLSEANLHSQPTWAAHMTPAVSQSALLGQLIAGLHNGNLLSADIYPRLAEIEAQLIRWFCLLFKQKNGHFTHGSSYGNLEALWQARERGMTPSNIIYGSSAAHYSIAKSCRILGLEFRPIATDQQGRMQITELKSACQKDQPLAIVATAGTSSCGAIDSLSECIDIAHTVHSWCHIDAAWGGALALLENQPYLSGIEHADSLCFDPHKSLGLAKPCSVLVYQHTLEPFTDLDVDYLSLTPNKTIAGSYGGELFIPLWFCLQVNQEEIISHIKQRLRQAELFAQILKDKTDWVIWHSPTGIVCFEAKDSQDLSLLEKKGIFSRAKINSVDVYRAVFANPTTTAKALITELEPYF